MSINDNKDITTSISRIQHSNNASAQGDCSYLPVISLNSNRTRINHHNDYPISPNNFKNKELFQSNFACGEPKQYQVHVSTSSATFIIPSSSELTIQHDIQSIQNRSELLTLTKASNNHQESLILKKHWILMTFVVGMIIIFITITILNIIR